MTYPSIPFYYRPNISLVSNSLTQSLLLNQEYLEIVQTTIRQVIEVFQTKRLPYEPFKILYKRDSKSGITNKAGLYLILNIKSQEMYLGKTINFATRKATYMQGPLVLPKGKHAGSQKKKKPLSKNSFPDQK